MHGRTIRLTPLDVSDADEMAGVLADPALHRWIGGEPQDAGALQTWYAQLAVGHSADGLEEWFNWIVRRPDGEAVGTVQATVTHGGTAAEVAWVIGVPWQGRGYATDAVGALVAWLRAGGVVRIDAHVHPGHAASEAVARRAGLLPTGELHDGEQRWASE